MKFIPSPTGKQFILDRSYLKLIMGPVGGGKSTVCLMDLLARANEQEPFEGLRRSKFAIVRNTAAQLNTTVKPLIDEWLVTIPSQTQGRALGRWRITESTFEISGNLPDGTRMFTEIALMPADTPDDVQRLLSLSLTAAWVEEAREIDPEVFKALIGRVDRFPAVVMGGATRPGVICSTNAPAVETYWQKFVSSPPSNARVFIQPHAVDDEGVVNPEAENLLFLSQDYYPNLIAANSAEWVDVYLRNKFGLGKAGRAVYASTFKRTFHVAKAPLLAVPDAGPLVVGMDNGRQAGAVVMQQDARGRVNLLSCAYVPAEETMGAETFLDRILIPHLVARYKVRRDRFMFVLDPACFQRSQINEGTIAMAVMARGFAAERAASQDPDQRQAALEGLLNRQVDGGAGFLIDPSATHVIDGMEFGFRYKRAPNGQTSLQRDKTHHSHTIEAAEYAALHFNGQFSPALKMMRRPRREVKPASFVYV